MPYPNEHSFRLKDPALFAKGTFKRTAGGTIYGKIKVPKTIGIIWGKLKGKAKPSDMPIPQALRFSVKSWTVAKAKKWMKDNNVKYIKFEPAVKKKESVEEMQLTANPSFITDTAYIFEILTPANDIIDIGCGSGNLIKVLDEFGANRLVGLDIDKKAVKQLKGEGYAIKVADMETRLPFENNEFDVAIMQHSLEYCKNRVKVIKEGLRISKKLIVTIPIGEEIDTTHKIIYSKVEDFESDIKVAGYNNFKIRKGLYGNVTAVIEKKKAKDRDFAFNPFSFLFPDDSQKRSTMKNIESNKLTYLDCVQLDWKDAISEFIRGYKRMAYLDIKENKVYLTAEKTSMIMFDRYSNYLDIKINEGLVCWIEDRKTSSPLLKGVIVENKSITLKECLDLAPGIKGLRTFSFRMI